MAIFSKLLVYQKAKTVFLLRKNDETWWLFTSKHRKSCWFIVKCFTEWSQESQEDKDGGAMDYLEGTYLVVHLVFSYRYIILYIYIYSIIHICDYPEIVKIIQNMWRSKIYPSWCFFGKLPHSILSTPGWLYIYIHNKMYIFLYSTYNAQWSYQCLSFPRL